MNIPKFRAWFPDLKKMVSVDKIDFYNEVIIYDHFEENNGYILQSSSCPIKDCILMQSTGLTDKNGILIFEGDIVRFTFDFVSCGETNHHDGYHMVYMDERGIGLQFKKLAWIDDGKNQIWNVERRGLFFKDKVLGYWANDMKSCVQCEVVGSFYANKELLNDN